MSKKSKGTELVEAIDLSEAFTAANIDEANGIIKNVVIMTGNKVSKNKTKYLDSAVQEAVTRYEGAKMYLDHPRKDELDNRRGNRSVRDIGGVYQNVHLVEGKVKGDVKLMEHNKAITLSIAKNPPKGTGMSLRDRGIVREEKGIRLVEGFDGEDFSIDLVTTASLNAGLFESQDEGGEEVMDYKEIKLDELKKERPDLVESIGSEAKASLAKQLEEVGVKSLEADKLVALSEAVMPMEFKAAIKSAILKKEVTLEEAKAVIAGQVKLAESVAPKGKGSKDPVVKGLKPQEKQLEEGAEQAPDDAAFEKAFKS